METPAEHSNFTVIDGGKPSSIQDPNRMLKCFESELKSVRNMTIEELFSGFNTIKAITFSYNTGFINMLMSYFDYGEIILGGDFIVRKDPTINNMLVEVCTNAYEAGQAVKRYNRLVDMLTAGDIEIKTPKSLTDHRKIYLLKADDGRTRVIKPTANMSYSAWNNSQLENYEFDDNPEDYEIYENYFETAWTMAEPITMGAISIKKTDDLVESNVILKSIETTGKAVIMQETDDGLIIEKCTYAIDHEKIRKDYKEILASINPKAKNGLIELVPKTLEKIKFNQKKLQMKQQITITAKQENYPELTFDLYAQKAFLNNEEMNLNPPEDDVKKCIDDILCMFKNFNKFVSSDTVKLQKTHFKLMNMLFCSPFHADLRCTCYVKGIPASTLPLFGLISSETSNSGKSFMIKAALKMMTGKELPSAKASESKKDAVRDIIAGVKGVPFFIDEVDNKYLTNITEIIKSPESCEENMMKTRAMIILASNDIKDPNEQLRKRMAFFKTDGALPSTVDKIAWEATGNNIIKNLGTAFYREYLRRMLAKVRDISDYIIHSKDLTEDYYPDLIKTSSETIIEMLKDYDYNIPNYITSLNWNDDYSIDSNCGTAINEIVNLYNADKKLFTLTKTKITITMNSSPANSKTTDSWARILPSEMQADIYPGRDCIKFVINRKEFENKIGYKLGGISLFRKK